MLCPVCDEMMLVVEFEGIELDACPRCRGMWFDADELRVLFHVAGAPEDAPVLEAALSALPRRRSRGSRRCPRCRRRLAEVVVVAGDPALELDVCERRDGFWFDRGELPRLLTGSIPDDGPRLVAVREFLGRFARFEEG